MNKTIQGRWVAALRSGTYVQGHSVLRDEQGRMCCLGVLCQLHAEETGVAWGETCKNFDSVGHAYLGEVAWLPREVRLWAELDFSDPYVPTDLVPHGKMWLSTLNDGWLDRIPPQSFAVIADLIEGL